jgi:hypothetical protein
VGIEGPYSVQYGMTVAEGDGGGPAQDVQANQLRPRQARANRSNRRATASGRESGRENLEWMFRGCGCASGLRGFPFRTEAASLLPVYRSHLSPKP